MEQIDWNKDAPEWATGRGFQRDSPKDIAWLGVNGYNFRLKPPFTQHPYNDYHTKDAFVITCHRNAWSGTGLPPVGTVCEFTSNDGRNWRETSIIFSDDNVILINGYTLYKLEDPDIAFRPIRTPEQIADEKRQQVLGDMMVIISKAAGTMYLAEMALVSEALFDAGYRLPTISE